MAGGVRKKKRENPDDSLLLPFFLTDVSMNNKFIVFDVVGSPGFVNNKGKKREKHCGTLIVA